MSSCERCVSVHVVLRLADVNHLVGVQLEHALHLQLTAALLCLVWGRLGHPLLLQLLPTSLALSDPSQVPEGQKIMTTTWVKLGNHKKSLLITSHINRGASHLQGKFAQISRLWQKSYFHLRWLYDSLVIDGIHSIIFKQKTHNVMHFFLQKQQSQIWEDCPFKQIYFKPMHCKLTRIRTR